MRQANSSQKHCSPFRKIPRFRYLSGDWQYTTVLPDGSIFGQTIGGNADRVGFSIECHLAAEKRNHLFFPKGSRCIWIFSTGTYCKAPRAICCGLLRSDAGGAKKANQVWPKVFTSASAIPAGTKCRTSPPSIPISFTKREEIN